MFSITFHIQMEGLDIRALSNLLATNKNNEEEDISDDEQVRYFINLIYINIYIFYNKLLVYIIPYMHYSI